MTRRRASMQVQGSRLAFRNAFYWGAIVVWTGVLGGFAWGVARETSPFRYLVLAVLVMVAIGVVWTAIDLARPRVELDGDVVRVRTRDREHAFHRADIDQIVTAEAGDMRLLLFMPWTGPWLRCVAFMLRDDTMVVVDELVGTVGPTRAVVRRLRAWLEESADEPTADAR